MTCRNFAEVWVWNFSMRPTMWQRAHYLVSLARCPAPRLAQLCCSLLSMYAVTLRWWQKLCFFVKNHLKVFMDVEEVINLKYEKMYQKCMTTGNSMKEKAKNANFFFFFFCIFESGVWKTAMDVQMSRVCSRTHRSPTLFYIHLWAYGLQPYPSSLEPIGLTQTRMGLRNQSITPLVELVQSAVPSI